MPEPITAAERVPRVESWWHHPRYRDAWCIEKVGRRYINLRSNMPGVQGLRVDMVMWPGAWQPMSEVLYVAQRECGDYYCGCGGGHIVGVFESEEAANLSGNERITAIPVGEAKWNADDYENRAWT